METPIKLALVDDQNLFREGLRLILETFNDLEICFEAESGQQLLEQLENTPTDVILLDYTMPEMDGLTTLKIIKEKHPAIKVIMLTMHFDESLMVILMQNGANGYLLKDETSGNVHAAILQVHKVGHYFPSYVSQALLKEIQNASQVRTKSPKSVQKEFSQREQEILALVGIYNRQEISDRLFISIKTVDFHLKNLRDKTNAGTTAELVRYALQQGFQD